MSTNNIPSSDFDLYKIALDTRNLEIDLFWKRSNYFLVLNTAIALGYFNQLSNCVVYQIFLGVFGFIVSILWIRVNLGSKYWQERWEGRLHKIERKLKITQNRKNKINFFAANNEVIENDVKFHLRYSSKNKKIICGFINYLILQKFSVSRSMIYLSILFSIAWFLLLLNSIFQLICDNMML